MAFDSRPPIAERFARLPRHLLDWMLPAVCCACDRPLPPGQGIRAQQVPRGWCDGCALNLPGLDSPRCPVCAEASPMAQTCTRCRLVPPAFDLTIALADYAPPLDRLVQAIKFARLSALATPLGRMLAIRVARETSIARGGPQTLIVALPLGDGRIARRGFNQSVLLALPVARALGLSLTRGLLRRTRDTPPASSLEASQRGAALADVFESAPVPDAATVIVVDDVMTTGATLQAAATALRNAGAGSVINCVAARTPAPGHQEPGVSPPPLSPTSC
jgi:ComF family protein